MDHIKFPLTSVGLPQAQSSTHTSHFHTKSAHKILVQYTAHIMPVKAVDNNKTKIHGRLEAALVKRLAHLSDFQRGVRNRSSLAGPRHGFTGETGKLPRD